MFGIGMPELIVILVIVLIIFGASKLPQIGEGIGREYGTSKRPPRVPMRLMLLRRRTRKRPRRMTRYWARGSKGSTS